MPDPIDLEAMQTRKLFLRYLANAGEVPIDAARLEHARQVGFHGDVVNTAFDLLIHGLAMDGLIDYTLADGRPGIRPIKTVSITDMGREWLRLRP